MREIFYTGLLIVVIVLLSSCSPAGGEDPGHEFMPDMFHSTAYEANLYDYYYYNTWGDEDTYKQYAMPRLPVKGTIPRGYAGMHQSMTDVDMRHFDAMPISGHVPYYYEDTEEERTRAGEEIRSNPFPISSAGLASGKKLYDIFCGICHGEAGDGLGYLVRDDGGVYPAAPANFLLPELVAASEGRYYHSIMHGKNVMGSYADKLSYEERWQVIHYIRALQAKNEKLQYDEEGNTLNSSAVALADWSKEATAMMDEVPHEGMMDGEQKMDDADETAPAQDH
ncbi:MAG: cytochrome c [Saprospiraceae bacterium]|nr:cytochrome c [Saprospiraceae bacterium]